MKNSIAYILAPGLGYLSAQAIKYILGRRQNKTWREWFRSGNMPSSHTAVVMSLVSIIFLSEGITGLLAVALTLAGITIYDALVARRSIGEQGSALLKLIENSPYAKELKPRVALGHEPLEVLAGIGLGVVVGLTVALFITV